MIPARPSWPPEVAGAVTSFAESLRRTRSGKVQALYIHGSLAQGSYQPGRSDIDFLGVTDSALTRPAISELQRFHGRLRLRFPRLRFNGSYLSAEMLAAGLPTTSPPLYVDGLSMSSDRTRAWNEVTRFELATGAIPLFGPPGHAYVGAPDVGSLLHYVLSNMNDYWVTWLSRIDGARLFDSAWAIAFSRRIEWGVLGVSRQFYTLRERSLAPKAEAGAYMLEVAPTEHHQILAEVIRYRSGQDKNLFVNRLARRRAAVAYMRWVIAEANSMATR